MRQSQLGFLRNGKISKALNLKSKLIGYQFLIEIIKLAKSFTAKWQLVMILKNRKHLIKALENKLKLPEVHK